MNSGKTTRMKGKIPQIMVKNPHSKRYSVHRIGATPPSYFGRPGIYWQSILCAKYLVFVFPVVMICVRNQEVTIMEKDQDDSFDYSLQI